MTFHRLAPFLHDYARLPEKTRAKVEKCLRLMAVDSRHPSIKARKMQGYDDLWEARVNGHYRLTFQRKADGVILRRVGTHEIYRKP